MIKYIIFVSFTIFFINNCSFSNHLEKNFINIKNLNLFKNKPKIILSNFDTTAENIIIELLKSNNILISHHISFFVNLLKNKSNIVINKKKLTDVIKNKIIKNTHNVYFFEKKNIDKNKKKLGLSNIKDSIDISTAMLLSRNNHIKYYLHSCLFGKKNPFLLKIQLILVPTGEIVFEKKEKFYW